MNRRTEARTRAAALARRREDVRTAMADMKEALGKTNDAGSRTAWVLPAAAGALGIAIAWSLRRLRKR